MHSFAFEGNKYNPICTSIRSDKKNIPYFCIHNYPHSKSHVSETNVSWKSWKPSESKKFIKDDPSNITNQQN